MTDGEYELERDDLTVSYLVDILTRLETAPPFRLFHS